MDRVVRIANLRDQDDLDTESALDSTAEERFESVEMIRQAAWELYGKPDYGLERVLTVADFPPG